MVCLILLVGHLWTCSACLWPPHSGSFYIEVSVSMTAVHTWYTCTLIWDRFWLHITGLCRIIQHCKVAQLSWTAARPYVFLLTEGEPFNYINFLLVSSSWTICRGPWMCKLRCHLHPFVATGWNWPLSVQRLWTVPQDERPEPTAYQAQT